MVLLKVIKTHKNLLNFQLKNKTFIRRLSILSLLFCFIIFLQACTHTEPARECRQNESEVRVELESSKIVGFVRFVDRLSNLIIVERIVEWNPVPGARVVSRGKDMVLDHNGIVTSAVSESYYAVELVDVWDIEQGDQILLLE